VPEADINVFRPKARKSCLIALVTPLARLHNAQLNESRNCLIRLRLSLIL